MSHNTHPVCGAHGSTRNVVGSAIMRHSPPPSISAMPKPPPGVKTGNAVLCAVSLARSVVVIEQPLRIAAAASPAMTDFPRRMPCWSGNERRKTSSPYSSIHLSALTATSYCSSFHNPWRSTKLCAVLSCDEDTGLTYPAETSEVSRFIFGVRAPASFNAGLGPLPAYMHQVIVFIALYQDWLRDREHAVCIRRADGAGGRNLSPARAFLRSRRDRWTQ